MRKLTRKEQWYFLKQDIISYLEATLLYIVLSLIKDFSWQSVVYGIFDCLVFYIPFWIIRICFAKTYHSDKWKHCKKWTKIMLNSGVFTMWLLPIRYSVFNGIIVAFMCCLILYWVALEVDEKKALKKENEELRKQIEELLLKHNNPEQRVLDICAEENISERDTQIAVMYFIKRKPPKDIWNWLIENHWDMELDSVYKLLNRLNKKVLPKLK